MCVDFIDLNKACPKDGYPIHKIDKLVNSTAGHELMSFMDAFLGYHQIPLAEEDLEKMSFTTDTGLHCYNVIPFGLKNAGHIPTVGQEVFMTLIGKTIEVYVDNMITKSIKEANHVRDLEKNFQNTSELHHKAQPQETYFRSSIWKFFLVHDWSTGNRGEPW